MSRQILLVFALANLSLLSINSLTVRKLKLAAIVSISLLLLIGLVFFMIGYLRPKVAGIYVTTNPSATVFINSEQVGRTPYRATRDPDEITVELIPESFQVPLAPYETKVTLVAGVETVLQRDFGEIEETSAGEIISFEKVDKDETSLSVVTIPDQAQLLIDGRERVFTPYKTSSLLPGEHALVISANGYKERVVEVKTHDGYKLTAIVKLAKEKESEEEQPVASEAATQDQDKEEEKELVEILTTPTGYLRVRAEPSSLGNEVSQVEPGETYTLIETDEKTGWFKIEYLPALPAQAGQAGEEAKVGWISNQYARKVAEKITPTPTSKPKATPTPI